MTRFMMPMLLRCCCALAAISAAGFTCAGEVAVSPDDCKTGTHLVAHGATLTEVLQRMSAVLGFKLHVGEPSASIVDVNLSGRGPDLVAKLAQSSNLMVRTSRYPQCPGRYRISEVWMLP